MKPLPKILRHKFNSLTKSQRTLPNALIIGTVKGGTSSLFHYLTQHPQIFGSEYKETRFFDGQFDTGEQFYRACFPLKSTILINRLRFGKEPIILEATPSYIFHPLAPRRISKTLGNIPCILILRDPVERAYSNYKHEVKRGRESRSFTEAIEHEFEDLSGERERVSQGEVAESYKLNHHSYLTKSLYFQQLTYWLKWNKKENLYITKSSDFFNNPNNICSEIFQFLDLPPYNINTETIHNQNQYSSMTTAERSLAYSLLQDDMEKLADEFGIRFLGG